MESFGSIECFVRSAEGGSFAEAARHLSLTPAAVVKALPSWRRASVCGCSSAALGVWR